MDGTLNERVAAEVFGLNVTNGYFWVDTDISCPDGNKECAVLHSVRMPVPIEDYSGGIGAAWLVVERLTIGRARTFDLFKDSDGDWFAKFDKRGEDRGWWNEMACPEKWVGSDGHSAAKAICEAALKTVIGG